MSAHPPLIPRPCHLLISYTSPLSSLRESDLLLELETKDDDAKVECLKYIISQQSLSDSGATIWSGKVMMSIIKYCLNSSNHLILKLLLLYWETVEKKNKDGAILSEMYLVCNALKNNLTHPNEFIRGNTLRFLQKVHESEILESLIPSITANLDHRHSYVRKNCIVCIHSIYDSHRELIPDAPDLIDQFLYSETNPTCKRNAFVCLYQCHPEKAMAFLSTILGSLPTLSEAFQLSSLEIIRKVCRVTPSLKSQYIRSIYNLVLSTNPAVAYEGANTLISLSSAATAVRAAVKAYTSLLIKESDNNVKLIILSRLSALRKRNPKILQESLMDIMRALITPNTEIRKKILDLSITLLSPRLVDDVVNYLKKELERTQSPEMGTAQKSNESYRKIIVETLHQCAVRFTEVVPNVVNILINFLGEEAATTSSASSSSSSLSPLPSSSPTSSSSPALDVVYFVREIVEEYPLLRDSVLQQVMSNFDEIRTNDVYRVVCWIFGEYCTEGSPLEMAISTLKKSIGPLPLAIVKPLSTDEAAEAKAKMDAEDDGKKGRVHRVGDGGGNNGPKDNEEKDKVHKNVKKPVVLADGTYASQSAIISSGDPSASTKSSSSLSPSSSSHSHLRHLLLSGDYFLAASVASSLTKLTLRFVSLVGYGTPEANESIAQSMLILVCLLRIGATANAVKPIDPDSHQRILTCIKTLMEPQIVAPIFTSDRSRSVYSSLLSTSLSKDPRRQPVSTVIENAKEVDDLISFRHLKLSASPTTGADQHDTDDLLDDDFYDDVSKAVLSKNLHDDTAAKLNRVHQLTGFSDPIYAECHMKVNDFDISLSYLLINQTNFTLQNVHIELYTSGDLKIIERPVANTMAANGIHKCHGTIKMTSTESAIIFGNITFDNSSGTQKTIIVMSNIHMDIMDYISPSDCSDQQFRSMWLEFEWENKVAVSTEIADLNEYLHHILHITNMKLMTPDSNLSGECNFMAANLYAKSMFGEDALLNLSVEKQKTGKIMGFIRIRSKTQGIALSLGDKITAKQKSVKG